MADTKEKSPKSGKSGKDGKDAKDAKGAKGAKGGKGQAGAAEAVAAAPALPPEPTPVPRLRTHYVERVRPALARQFGLVNPHQIPRVSKIVLNVGFGEGPKVPKALEVIVAELAAISGQKPVVTRAKKAISNFSLRVGMAIGAAVTLRGVRMYEFLDRFIGITVPRIRDFRGLPTKSFDGRGNYSFGVKEQMIFPEINYDKVERIHGMDITIVTTAGRDDLALALLREMGMPFRGEAPVSVG
jgi:large subunit ribosomal protein L5